MNSHNKCMHVNDITTTVAVCKFYFHKKEYSPHHQVLPFAVHSHSMIQTRKQAYRNAVVSKQANSKVIAAQTIRNHLKNQQCNSCVNFTSFVYEKSTIQQITVKSRHKMIRRHFKTVFR